MGNDKNNRTYYAPTGGLPPQTQLLTDRAMFTEAYAIIPKGTFSDIVTSFLPFWDKTRLWVIARPLSGFAETFSQYIMEVQPGGGSDRAELDEGAEGVLFVVEGEITVTVAGKSHTLTEGGYAYLPPKSGWTLRNNGAATARFHWVRKAYEYVDGLDVPEPLFLNEKDIAPNPMPDTNGAWATTRFVDPNDLRHDMHVTIVTFEPGGSFRLPKPMSWSTGFTCWKEKPSIGSIRTGWKWRPAISCGCAPSARRPVMQAAPASSATCSIRTSTGT